MTIKSYNLDPKICQKIDDLCALLNKNRSKIIEDAVERYRIDTETAQKEVAAIEKEAAELKNRAQKYSK